MKKILLGTTAMVGASMLMAGAAMAGDPPKLTMSGNVKFEAWWASQDANTGRNRGYDFFVDDAEIVFQAQAKADNGLTYGAKIEYEFENSATDEAVIFLKGNWGELWLGNEDGADDLMKVSGYSILSGQGAWDGSVNDIINMMAVNMTGPNMVGDNSDANKATYFSPMFSGFRFGVSITPDSGHNFDAVIADSSATQSESHLGWGVEYKNAKLFNDISLHASVRGIYANPENDTTSAYEQYMSWGLGANIGWKGFSLAGGYTDNGDSGMLKTATAAGQDAGKYWDVALAYTTGPYKVSAGYFHSWEAEGTGVDDDEVDWFTVSGNYTVAPGLDVYAEYNYIEIEDSASITTANDNTANVFMVGTKVSF